ncbi:MAG TPA: methylated-DNA--[protein]-cysteine S-methyltransferase [Thermoanaerobaculia bacterium]
MTQVVHTWTETPIGPLLLVRSRSGLSGIRFAREGEPAPAPEGSVHDAGRFEDVIEQLRAYFARRLQTFELELDLQGTPFQLEVWRALLAIPYGRTTTYTSLAAMIERPAAVRAAGSANGANPIPIIVPCHRVIGARGALTGFGGGLPVKRYLLDLEAYAGELGG